jgi:hypothetical protein
MTDQATINQWANEIRDIYVPDSDQTEKQMEQYLKGRLVNLPELQRLSALKKLIVEFDSSYSDKADNFILDDDVMPRIYSLLLGKDVSQSNLSSTELLQRLAESLNTIFDTLNELIRIMNITLYDKCQGRPGIQTIIESNPESLENYLGQIKTTFKTVQTAFERSAEIGIDKILKELDPEQISDTHGGWLNIAPLKKAECYEVYKGRYRNVKHWFNSGKFIEDFRREFENSCQNLLKD